MSAALDYAFKFIGVPLVMAIVVYIVTHFQLLLFNSLLHLEVRHKTRTKINITSFFVTFFLTLGLVAFNEFMKPR